MTDEERQQAMAKFRELQEKTNAEILAVLTSEQKETWTKLQGKKFDFPQLRASPVSAADPAVPEHPQKRWLD